MDDGYSWFLQDAGIKKPTAKVVAKKEPSKPKVQEVTVLAVAWNLLTDEDQTKPSIGRVVTDKLMDVFDVTLDGLKITGRVKTDRYLGWVIVFDFVNNLKRNKTVSNIWVLNSDGTHIHHSSV